MPIIAASVRCPYQKAALPGRDAIQPELVQLVSEISDLCKYDDQQRAREGSLLAHPCMRFTLTEDEPGFELVRNLIALGVTTFCLSLTRQS
jgi:hypothetical protein